MIQVLLRLLGQVGRWVGATAVWKVLLAVCLVLWFSASGFLYFEMRDKPDLGWADAFWWAFVTMTTVGYGDLFPSSAGGRFLVGIPTMLFGVGLFGYLLSAVATFLIESHTQELKGMKRVGVSGHILLVHYSDTNRVLQIVRELQQDAATRGKPIVLVDHALEELPRELADLDLKFVRGNPARQATLEQANVAEATHAIVLAKDPHDPRSDDLNLAVAMTIEGLKSGVHTVTECVDPESVEVLRRTGSDSVVCGAHLTAGLLVQELLDPGVQHVFHELSSVSVGQQIYIAPILRREPWTFADLRAWAEARRHVALGLERSAGLLLNPEPATPLLPDDRAVLLGAARLESVQA